MGSRKAEVGRRKYPPPLPTSDFRLPTSLLFFLLLCTPATAQTASTIRGSVDDAATAEPLSRALVSIRELNLETQTDSTGRFEITGVPAGEIDLYISTVGYGLVRRLI